MLELGLEGVMDSVQGSMPLIARSHWRKVHCVWLMMLRLGRNAKSAHDLYNGGDRLESFKIQALTIRFLRGEHGGSRRLIVGIAILHLYRLWLELWVEVASMRCRHREMIGGRNSLAGGIGRGSDGIVEIVWPWSWSWKAWVGHHVIHRLPGYLFPYFLGGMRA